MPEPIDFGSLADMMARALDLPLHPDDKPGVVANLEIAFRLAPLFLGHPLPDEAEPAATYAVGEAR
jgi:hypothetical protein